MGAAFRFIQKQFSRARAPWKIALSGGGQIVGRRFARAAICHDFVGDLLAFTQRSEAGTLDSADVHEHVIAAGIRLDEAIALGCVKPLHGSHAQGGCPFPDIPVLAAPSMSWCERI